MSTLPSREVVESFAFPEHSTKAPRGICPSTNRTALPGYVLKWLAALNSFRTSGERPQTQCPLRNLQDRQFSTISKPYGVFISATLLGPCPLGLATFRVTGLV